MGDAFFIIYNIFRRLEDYLQWHGE